MKLRISGVARRLLLLLAVGMLTSSGAAAQSNTITVIVPGTAAPWSCSGVNAGDIYGGCGSASPVVVSAANGLSFQPGDSLTVTYVSGMASQYGTCPFAYCYDANGFGAWNDTYDPCCGYLPSKYIPAAEYPVGVMTLVGVFTDSSGTIVGTPHRLGDGPTTLVVPTGATRFQMGVNDDLYGDNNGSFTVQVTGKPSITLTLTLDKPLPLPSNPDPRNPTDSLLNAKVFVADPSGAGVPNYSVDFLSMASNLSVSGHTHNNLSDVPLGVFKDSTGTCSIPTSGLTATCTTDSSGYFTITYKVPEFSGAFNLTASSTKDPTVADTQAFLSQMPPLSSLSLSTTYRLTGNTGKTQYGGCRGTLIQHPSNHFGTAYLIAAIADIGSTYLQQTGFTLGINDMTLPVGGEFDICADWNLGTNPTTGGPNGHFSHRKGTSVDLDSATMSGHKAQPIDMLKLTFLATKIWRLRQSLEEPIHFESPF